MKHITYISLIGILGCIFSCSKESASPLAVMEDSIKVYLLENLDDPNSYESVKSEILDTTLYVENLEHMKSLMIKYAESMDSEYGKDAKLNYLNQADLYQKKLDSMNLSSDPNAIAAYRVLHTFRAKNKFGALVLNQLKFEFKPTLSIYKVREMSDPKGSPGGLP